MEEMLSGFGTDILNPSPCIPGFDNTGRGATEIHAR